MADTGSAEGVFSQNIILPSCSWLGLVHGNDRKGGQPVAPPPAPERPAPRPGESAAPALAAALRTFLTDGRAPCPIAARLVDGRPRRLFALAWIVAVLLQPGDLGTVDAARRLQVARWLWTDGSGKAQRHGDLRRPRPRR